MRGVTGSRVGATGPRCRPPEAPVYGRRVSGRSCRRATRSSRARWSSTEPGSVPRSLPASSQVRSRSASSAAGWRAKRAASSAGSGPPWRTRLAREPADSRSTVGGVDRAAVALGQHVQGDRRGHPGGEEAGQVPRSAGLVTGVDLGVDVAAPCGVHHQEVAHVVEQGGGDQLVGRAVGSGAGRGLEGVRGLAQRLVVVLRAPLAVEVEDLVDRRGLARRACGRHLAHQTSRPWKSPMSDTWTRLAPVAARPAAKRARFSS